MNERSTATYIPLTTERTKQVVKHLEPGPRQTIDLVHAQDHDDQIEGQIWAVEDGDGVHFTYEDGPQGGAVYLGFADQVRVLFEEAPVEEKYLP